MDLDNVKMCTDDDPKNNPNVTYVFSKPSPNSTIVITQKATYLFHT